MAVGKWKAARVPVVYTGSSYTGHARVMDYCSKTLTNIKNAILNFGNWTWNDTIHILEDSTVIAGYGMAYTTIEYINGTKLWVAFTGLGVPLHYKCFSQVRQGKSSDTNGSMFPALVDKNNTNFFINEEGGGWQAGLIMSLLPAGLNENYGTPTFDSPDWFPTHATPICGYYGDYREAYARGQFRTAASTLTSPEQIFIINQDDCFTVLAQSANWGGATSGLDCTFCPRTQGYITGRIFEATNSQDNQPYAHFGWLCGQFNAYRNNAGNRTDIFAWDARYGEYSNQCRAFYPYTLQSVTGSAGLSVSTEAAYPRGAMGWFTADGKRFNQCSGNTSYYLKGIGTGMGSYITSGFVSDQIETDPSTIHFYPLIAGTNVINENWNPDTRSPLETSAVKGIIRRDLMLACDFKSTSENIYAQLPAQGAKLAGSNYIMGPSYCCFGWNPSYSENETESLNPFRQHAKFYKDTEATDVFGNSVFCNDICSNSSGVYMVAVDSSEHPRFAKISLGVTTGATVYTANDITALLSNNPSIMVNNADGVIYAFIINATDTVTRYSLNASTMVPTAVSTVTMTDVSYLEISQNRGGIWSIMTRNSSGLYDINCFNGSTLLYSYNGDTTTTVSFHSILNCHFNDIVVYDNVNGLTYLTSDNSRTGWQATISDKVSNIASIIKLIVDNADRIYIFGNTTDGKIFCCKFKYDGTFIKTRYYENYGALNTVFFNKNEYRFHLIGLTADSSKSWIATLSLDGVFDYCNEYTLNGYPHCLVAENANDYVVYNGANSPDNRTDYAIFKRSWAT